MILTSLPAVRGLSLIPNIKLLFDCPYYWGKIDMKKAKALFDGKSDGSFLLKDVKGEEFGLELVYKTQSKLRKGRIKIDTVLCENINDFKPIALPKPNDAQMAMYGIATEKWLDNLIDELNQKLNLDLESPIIRNQPFSLQDLAAAKTCDLMNNYEKISQLEIPKELKKCLRRYRCTNYDILTFE